MKKTLKDYFVVLFGSAFARGIAFLNSIIIARLLGPKEFGKFSLFYVTMILTWQITEAFDTTFVRYAKTSNCKSEKRDFLKTALFFKYLYFCILLCLSYPLSYMLTNYCFKKPEMQSILILSLICGIFLSFLKTVASTFQEKEKFVEFTSLHALYTCSIFCILILLKTLKISFTLSNVILAYLIISIIIGVSCIYLLRKKTGDLLPLNIKVFKTSFSLGKWIFGVTSLHFLFQRMDILFLTRYLKFDLIGIYSVAAQLIMAISLMTGSFAGVFLPKASTALKSKSSFKTYLKESILCISGINLFVIVLIITAPFLVKIIYGNEYILAGSILRILLIGWFISILYLPFASLFYTLNDSKTRFFLESLKFIIGFTLLYLLIPEKGLFGAAIAVTLTLSLYSIISLIVIIIKIKPKVSKLNEY